jgi:hypothetical protein
MGLLNENQTSIIIIFAIIFSFSLFEHKFPDVFPKLKCPSTLTELTNYDTCENYISISVIIKFAIIITTGYVFRNEFQFVMISLVGFQLIEEFLEIPKESCAFSNIGGVKPYIFGNFIYNLL